MHREDNSKYLLFIEPDSTEKLDNPISDELSHILSEMIKMGEKGTSFYSNLNDNGTFTKSSGYKGTHITNCGERSSNYDILLPNGMITNSLCVFYLEWYRNSIPKSEIKKLEKIKNYWSNFRKNIESL
jgi:hypothetical protein